jgi:lipoate-protein ligase A
VILRAVRKAGIDARKNGRNDIETDGRKFSGNAYYQSGKNAYHHGTLLVKADISAASKYLSVSQDKIKAKSVESVRQRIINLTECAPDLTISKLKALLVEAFDEVYGTVSTPLTLSSIADEFSGAPNRSAVLEQLGRFEKQFADPAWKYGKNPPFTFASSARFSWGGVEITLNVEHNVITEAAVFSDAMDESFILELAPCLKEKEFTRAAVCESLKAHIAPFIARNPGWCAYCEDIADLIFENRGTDSGAPQMKDGGDR